MRRLHRTGFLALAIAIVSPQSLHAQTDASLGAVLVTGAPSGIGRKITELLASKGYWVYAGARTQQEMDALNAIRNVKAVREIVQLNTSQPYSLNRDALVKMLDDALARIGSR